MGLNKIESPVNGGEQRSYWFDQIFERLEIAHEYRSRSECLAYFRPAKSDRPVGRRFQALVDRVPYSLFRDLGYRRSQTRRLWRRLADDRRRIESADVVVFDQPFGFPFYGDAVRDKAVVYASQNIEARILGDYFNRPVSSRAERRRLDERIQSAEATLAKRADLVVACTESDSAYYRSLGARWVCCAPNGSTRLGLSSHRDPRETLDLPFDRYAFMVSSGWAPNAAGLVEYCADLRLPDGCGLVCAGGIAESAHPEFSRIRENPAIFLPGRVSEAQLASLVAGCSAIVIPTLDKAGGSNVKTAEALLTDRTIIATPAAFRGCAAFERAPGVCLAESPEEFSKEIARQLEREPARWSRPETEALEWPNALRPAEDALRELIHRMPHRS